MIRAPVALLVAGVVAAEPTFAQTGPGSRSAIIFESYAIDDGFSTTDILEGTVPLSLSTRLGRFGTLTVSGGYTVVSIQPQTGDDVTLSGPLDTEARLSVNLIPSKLVLLVTGAAPTGQGTIESAKIPILPVIATDVIGFAVGELGSGGYVGSGFAGAFPVGRMALGVAATFRQAFSYEPIQESTTKFKPGSEVRIRTGLEGPLGPRTYIRVAGILAIRQKDQIDDVTVNGVGNRSTAYVSLNHGLGSTSFSAYTFGVFRSDPQIESTALGGAVLPRGNLLAFGGQWSLPVSRSLAFVPTAEYRVSHAAPDTSATSLDRLGSTFRFGLKLEARTGRNTTLVLQGSGLTGDLRQLGGSTPFNDVRGFRAAVHVEVKR